MSSFFLKNKPKSSVKRKHENPSTSRQIRKGPQKKQKDEENDDEIDSDDAFDSAEELDKTVPDVSDEDDIETPQDKRVRLAKKYLEEIETEEKNRAEDKDIHDHVSKRLHDEYLDSVGKLRRNIADTIKGYKEDSIKILKHKRQHLPLTTVVVSSDNKFIFSGGKNSHVIKWDIETQRPVGMFDVNPHTEEAKTDISRRSHILAMCLSTDSKFLALAEGGNNIQIWCPKELKHLKTFKGHRDTVHSLIFRRDSHDLYSASKDRSVKLWSLDEMAYVESLFGHQAGLTSIDALSRERAITSGGIDCTVRIWKITEETQLIYNGHRGCIENVKFINEENFISSGNDGSLCLWSALKKKPQHIESLTHGVQSNGDPNWITAITTLVNSDLIASGSWDGYIRLWKMSENGRKIVPLTKIPINGFINSLTFNSDGSRLIAAVGQEHRLGRWWRIKEAKNIIVIIELEKNSSKELIT